MARRLLSSIIPTPATAICVDGEAIGVSYKENNLFGVFPHHSQRDHFPGRIFLFNLRVHVLVMGCIFKRRIDRSVIFVQTIVINPPRQTLEGTSIHNPPAKYRENLRGKNLSQPEFEPTNSVSSPTF